MSLDESWGQADRIGTIAGGRYRIVGEVAGDARRSLYDAEDIELGQRVLLAIVPAGTTPTGDRLRSADTLRALEHPGLVRVLASGALDGGELFVVTERAVGTPLRAVVAGKPLEQRRALTIVRRVAEAVAAIHAAGAIHGDIRPESIFVWMDGSTERVKLTDVGIAALAGRPAAADARYAAPECDAGEIDARADLYALGAVLFELLTGHAPFFADDANSLRRLHAYAPVQTLGQRAPDRTFPRALEELVAMALTKKREARLQTATDMIGVLDHALQSIEELAPAPPPRRTDDGNDSLLLMARDLMPAAARPAQDLPVVPANVGREVPELPWPTRAVMPLRRAFGRASRRMQRIVRALAIALPVALVLGLALTCHGHRAATPVVDTAVAQIALGQARLAAGDERGALDAYQHAIRAQPATATHADVLAPLGRIADSHDPAIGIAALDVIATWSGPDGYDAIARRASSSPTPQVRHRAWSLAEQAGITGQIDRVASWILDLDQATTCEQRRAAIGKLADQPDPRVAPALRAAKARPCVGN